MRYATYLILFLISLSAGSDAFADTTRYRVEVLLLTHLNHGEEALETSWIEDYSNSLDFLTPLPPDDETGEPVETGVTEEPDGESGLSEDGITEVEDVENPLNAVVHLEEMGPEMAEAWRRLRLSGPFRPLLFLGWEQGNEEPFPVLRLHDLEVVLVDDPYAALRESQEENLNTGSTFGDTEADPLPDPKLYYELDGTLSLTRSRFLHLDLDLQWREAKFERVPAGILSTRPVDTSEFPEAAPTEPSAFLVHGLKQKRQVKSGRMEYFDGPVLGVLAFITSITISEDQN